MKYVNCITERCCTPEFFYKSLQDNSYLARCKYHLLNIHATFGYERISQKEYYDYLLTQEILEV